MLFKDFFNEDNSINWKRVETTHEFCRLAKTPQSKIWHQEGDVLTHTKMVCAEMAKLLENNGIAKGTDVYTMSMIAALCHDLGKADTTKWSDEKNDYETKNHGIVGERITRKLFMEENIHHREMVCYMVRHHMTLHHVLDDLEKTDDRLIKLSYGLITIHTMLMLNEADSRGSKNDIETDEAITEKVCKIRERCQELDCYNGSYSRGRYYSFLKKWNDIVTRDSDENNHEFVVYIMCGFPGCGKSTYIKNYLPNIKVISRDIIRCELGIGGATVENQKKVVGNKEEEDRVTQVSDEKIREYCEKKMSFVIDNTNLRSVYRKDILKKVLPYNPEIRIVYVEPNGGIEECMRRREGEIDRSVYERMSKSFDFPQINECNELTIVKPVFVDGKEQHLTLTFTNSVLKGNKERISLYQEFLYDLKALKICAEKESFLEDLIKEYTNKIELEK